jgi:hypothetical protein
VEDMRCDDTGMQQLSNNDRRGKRNGTSYLKMVRMKTIGVLTLPFLLRHLLPRIDRRRVSANAKSRSIDHSVRRLTVQPREFGLSEQQFEVEATPEQI